MLTFCVTASPGNSPRLALFCACPCRWWDCQRSSWCAPSTATTRWPAPLPRSTSSSWRSARPSSRAASTATGSCASWAQPGLFQSCQCLLSSPPSSCTPPSGCSSFRPPWRVPRGERPARSCARAGPRSCTSRASCRPPTPSSPRSTSSCTSWAPCSPRSWAPRCTPRPASSSRSRAWQWAASCSCRAVTLSPRSSPTIRAPRASPSSASPSSSSWRRPTSAWA